MISTRCEPRKFPIPSHALFLWAKRLKGTLWSYNICLSQYYILYTMQWFSILQIVATKCALRLFAIEISFSKKMHAKEWDWVLFPKGKSNNSGYFNISWNRGHIFELKAKVHIHVRIIKKVVGICEKSWYKLKYHGPGLSITLQTRTMPFVGRHRLSKAAG